MKIGVVGIWHLGEVIATSLAELGHTIIAVDKDQKIIEELKKGIPPLEEPGLKGMLSKNLTDGLISFENDFSSLKDCGSIFLTFDTPVNENDESDLSIIYSTVKNISPHIGLDTLLVVMSQVPVGTTKKVLEIIKQNKPQFTGEAIYFPENLQLGKALNCFLKPDRFVVGVESEKAKNKFEEIIGKINCPRQYTNIPTAEMTKHALNSFLATSLSFIYNISDLCEQVGADVTEVSEALRSDKRIGQNAYLDSSLGFSGGTLMRDLKTLVQVSSQYGISLPVIHGVLESNIERRKLLIDRLIRIFNLPSNQLKLGILGITYKPGTSTLRRSLGLEVANLLLGKGAGVGVYDPGAPLEELEKIIGLEAFSDPYTMATGCNGLLLITAWSEFKLLDFEKLKSKMTAPYIFFDTRNFLRIKEDSIKNAGFKYVGLGRF